MDDERSSPWAEEVIEARLAAAVEEHFPALAVLLSPEEAAELKPLCLQAFRNLVFASNADDPEVVFREAIPHTAREAFARGGDDLRQVIADGRVLEKLGSLDRWIHPLAWQAADGTLALTPDLRETLGAKDRELRELLDVLKAKHPHLEDSRQARPALSIIFPRMVKMRVGKVICDFRFVRDYTKGRIMSIELAHEVGHLPSRPA